MTNPLLQTPSSERRYRTSEQRQAKVNDWAKRLRKVNDEMELFFGELAGGTYPEEMEMAVNLAWRVLYREVC